MVNLLLLFFLLDAEWGSVLRVFDHLIFAVAPSSRQHFFHFADQELSWSIEVGIQLISKLIHSLQTLYHLMESNNKKKNQSLICHFIFWSHEAQSYWESELDSTLLLPAPSTQPFASVMLIKPSSAYGWSCLGCPLGIPIGLLVLWGHGYSLVQPPGFHFISR